MKKSFSYRGACAWNILPTTILEAHEHLSKHIFKKLSRSPYVDQMTPSIACGQMKKIQTKLI